MYNAKNISRNLVDNTSLSLPEFLDGYENNPGFYHQKLDQARIEQFIFISCCRLCEAVDNIFSEEGEKRLREIYQSLKLVVETKFYDEYRKFIFIPILVFDLGKTTEYECFVDSCDGSQAIDMYYSDIDIVMPIFKEIFISH